MNNVKLLCLIAFIFTFLDCDAQDESIQLFKSLERIDDIEVPPHVISYYLADMNFEELRNFPESVEITLPDNSTIIVNTSTFYTRKGYSYRDEEHDPPGPPIFITPGANLEEMAYFWAGKNDEYEVTITVRSTNAYGFITGNSSKYVIESRSNLGINRFFEVNPEGLRPAGETNQKRKGLTDINISENKFDESNVSISPLVKHNVNNNFEFNTFKGSQLNNLLDTLVVYTDEARINQGGDPFDVSDDVDIQLLIENSIDNTNLAFSNSDVNGDISTYYTTRLDGFTFTGTSNGYLLDLKNFRELTIVNNARTDVNADVVSGMIYADAVTFTVCGVAHVQTRSNCGVSNAPSCSSGSLFYDFAYNLVINECAVSDHTFGHEYGHLLGANHTRNSAISNGYFSDIIANGYPEAFAYITPVGQQKTLMAIETPTNTRLLHFSNPNVNIISEPSGVNGTEYNANEMNSLIPAVVNFETRPDLIFEYGFE